MQEEKENNLSFFSPCGTHIWETKWFSDINNTKQICYLLKFRGYIYL